MSSPPSGTLTFLFTDVEGSTRLWAEDPTAMSASLRVHDAALREVISAHGGYVFTTAGDAFCVAFDSAFDAVSCARRAQERLGCTEWPGPSLKVRMGLHRGDAESRDGDYFGPVVNVAARVESAGHGGQVIISDAVLASTDVAATDLGVHRLRDIPEPMRLHQVGDGLFPPLRVVPARLSSLPIPATSLVGRDGEVRALRSLLLRHRLVTITGVGGTGKTRLAIEVAERELAHYAHGAYFVDLRKTTDDDGVVGAIAESVRLHLEVGDPLAQILDHLSGKQALVVLDNCEHVIDACADFAEAALSRGDEWRLVATSRELLDVDGEHVMQAPPLATDEDGSAVELFADRAASADPGFRVDDGNRSTVRELCERLDGMPLAIELAAARIAVMSPAEMLLRIDDRFRLLSGGRRRTRQRQGTLEATLDWSYDLLDEDERLVLGSLGVLSGPFDDDLAAAVANIEPAHALDVLESLVAKSLVGTDRDGDRTLFHLLETVRAYAINRLQRRDGELTAARDRHLEYHLEAVAATAADAVDRFGSWVVWEWTTVQRWLAVAANLEAAIDWALATDRHTDAGELLVAATPVWREQMAFQAILDQIDVVAAAIPASSDLRERLLIPEVQFAMAINDRERWLAFADDAQHVQNAVVREFRLVLQANSCSMTDPSRSLRLADEAALFGSDPFLFWDKNRADIHLFAGEYVEAAAALRPLQGQNVWAAIDGTIAISLLMDGRPREALEVAERHPMATSNRMSFGIIVGLAHLALGAYEEARRELLDEARAAALGRVQLLGNSALVGLAALAHYEGDVDWATEIILGAGCQREVAINALARMVADQIGVREAFIDQQLAAAEGMANVDRTDYLREMLSAFEARPAWRPDPGRRSAS